MVELNVTDWPTSADGRGLGVGVAAVGGGPTVTVSAGVDVVLWTGAPTEASMRTTQYDVLAAGATGANVTFVAVPVVAAVCTSGDPTVQVGVAEAWSAAP
jgi:hypothetical protein